MSTISDLELLPIYSREIDISFVDYNFEKCGNDTVNNVYVESEADIHIYMHIAKQWMKPSETRYGSRILHGRVEANESVLISQKKVRFENFNITENLLCDRDLESYIDISEISQNQLSYINKHIWVTCKDTAEEVAKEKPKNVRIFVELDLLTTTICDESKFIEETGNWFVEEPESFQELEDSLMEEQEVFEQLVVDMSIEEANNDQRLKPAAPSSVKALMTEKFNKKGSRKQCSICWDVFSIGVDIKRMPCSHGFHKNCLESWLKLGNTCPLCRCELPT
ncbi:E3 ubiquitin-protein ligase ring1-like [Thalictrum thalictroides]|uniref:E3 ubiquitin-protein ligase ring1-like n=1 Tax=Thalictrum thalictroides TaxID=46969 RepID=A0A7J6VR67_THATH|nr:E3 ubiquitin-protein ligase ring1-like [Thalictrum thalictroides]